MKTRHLVRIGICAAVALAAALSANSSRAQGVPHYEPDLSWPKPLPDHWILGGLGGLCVDAQDHVLILNRQDVLPGELDAGRLAPPLIEFDPAGNVVHSWGDPKLLDARLHSCHFDKDGNVWIASAPSGMVQKYTHDGTIKGTPLNSNAAVFHMPSSIFVDRGNGDIFVSDGEGRESNRRVAVLDRDGNFLRQWKPEGMESVHCLTIGNDGLVYVCNRDGGRIQVYDKLGNLKRNIEVPWKPFTMPADGKVRQFGGAAVAIDFSPDPAQKYMFVINQNNSQIEMIERETGKMLPSFGHVGRYAGELDQPHGIAVDSKGNVYVDENRGRRVHKFKIVQ